MCSLLAIAEETLAEFMSKATGTAVNWVQMVGMKVMCLYTLYAVQYYNTPVVDISNHFESDADYSLVRIPLESSLFRTTAVA